MNSPRTLRLARLLSVSGVAKLPMKLSRRYSVVSSRRRIALDQDYADDAMSKFGYALPFNNLFPKKATRVVVPYENAAKRKISQALGKSGALGEKGYDRIDWETGEAVKLVPPNPKAPPGTQPKEQRTKLGKAIGRLPNGEELLDWWSNNKDAAKTDDYSIVISRHPIDVMRMSDHANIESCHSPNAGEWDSCVSEVKHGGLVSYLVNNEDLKKLSPEQISGRGEIFYDEDRGIEGVEPMSRLRVRRFTNEDRGFDLAMPEKRLYGKQNTAFKDQVVDWARKVQEPITKQKRWRMSEFTRRGGQYSDTKDGAIFNQFFGDTVETDYGSTDFGVAGKEGENLAERYRQEIEEIHDRWQRDFKHCNTSYEEYDDGGDEDISFYWSGSFGASFPESMLNPETLDEIEGNVNKGYGRDKNENSLYAYLNDNNIYPSDNEIYFSNYNGNVSFGIDIDDSDRGSGDPDAYDDFCRMVSDDWDDKYDQIRGVIYRWLLENDFAAPTPVREFWNTETQYQNFDLNFDDGELEAAAESPIGEVDPELWDEDAFKGHVDAQIRALVGRELDRIIRGKKNPAPYLPGFQPPDPSSIKENYNLSNFGLYVKMMRPDYKHIGLKLTFTADDLTTPEDMKEVTELLQVVDRIFPKIVAEGARLLESYYAQMRQYKRALPDYNDHEKWNNRTRFEFNPAL